MFPTRPDDYRRPDGSVVIPARVVERMLKLLELGVVAARQRGMGGAVNTDMVVVLDALHEAAERPSSAIGTTVPGSRSLEVSGKLLTAQSAADRIGCSSRAVRKACTEGRLRAVQVGRAWLIEEGELERWRYGDAGLVLDIED
jgi:excisionase family DNA binding protein